MYRTAKMRYSLISLYLFCFLPWSITITAQVMDDLMARNHELREAVDAFQDCLDNKKLPCNANCDFGKLQMEVDTLRTKYNLPAGFDLSHSLKVTLTEHTNVAQQQCIPPSLCFDLTKKCTTFNGAGCTKTQNPTLTCMVEYNNLIPRIVAAELAYNKTILEINATAGGGHTFSPAEILERSQKFDSFSKASANWRECRKNFAIPFNGACDDQKFIAANDRLINLCIENENDIGLIPLIDEIALAKLLCLYPSSCDKITKTCICPSASNCMVRPQNKGVTCAEEYLAFLMGYEAISSHRVTIPLNITKVGTTKPGISGRASSGNGSAYQIRTSRLGRHIKTFFVAILYLHLMVAKLN